MSHAPDTQSDVIAFLSDPATHGGRQPERIDTHISTVFLAGDTVYKLKKAVTLSFVDFAPLENRKAACDTELRVNQIGAPGIYQAVDAITREPDGTLAFNGTGEAVDYVVRMTRFDQSTLFDRMAADGKLNRKLMQRAAHLAADLHDQSEPRQDFGGAEALRSTVTGNRDAFRPNVPDVIDADALEALTDASLKAVERHAALLDQRRAKGCVRRCHGDLHLRNMALHDGAPILFDAIEFNDAFAVIDTLYDLSFLLMDLDDRGHRRLANIVLNAYGEKRPEVEGLALLPLMMSLRAAIRSHVAAAAAGQQQGEADAETMREEARRLFQRAQDYLDPPPPRLLAVGGLSGSGKSRMGRELAPFLGAAPGAAVFRTDVLRKQLAGVDPYDRLPPDAYGKEMSARTYEALYDHARRALAAGHSVVADAVFAKPEERAAIEQVAQEAGVPFTGLWLEAPPDVARARVTDRKGNVSDATASVLERQLEYDLGTITWTRIDTARPKDEALAAGRAVLGV